MNKYDKYWRARELPTSLSFRSMHFMKVYGVDVANAVAIAMHSDQTPPQKGLERSDAAWAKRILRQKGMSTHAIRRAGMSKREKMGLPQGPIRTAIIDDSDTKRRIIHNF